LYSPRQDPSQQRDAQLAEARNAHAERDELDFALQHCLLARRGVAVQVAFEKARFETSSFALQPVQGLETRGFRALCVDNWIQQLYSPAARLFCAAELLPSPPDSVSIPQCSATS
jgi:hypothetical protein